LPCANRRIRRRAPRGRGSCAGRSRRGAAGVHRAPTDGAGRRRAGDKCAGPNGQQPTVNSARKYGYGRAFGRDTQHKRDAACGW